MLIDKVKLPNNVPSTGQQQHCSSSACRGPLIVQQNQSQNLSRPQQQQLDANNNQVNSISRSNSNGQQTSQNESPISQHQFPNNPSHNNHNNSQHHNKHNNNNNNKIIINNSSTYNEKQQQNPPQFKSSTLPPKRSTPNNNSNNNNNNNNIDSSIGDSSKSPTLQQQQQTSAKLCHTITTKSHTWTGKTAKQEMAIVKQQQQQHQTPPLGPPAPPAQHQQSELCRQTNNQIVCEQNSSEPCSVNATMTIRRILQLYELGEYREAAQVISRLPYGIFRAVVLDLPVDAFVEAMPVSLPILDSLYAKVFFAGRDLLAFGFKFLHPENVVSHMIRMFAMGSLFATAENEEAISICKKLLKVILITDSSLRKQLIIKKALLDRAVEGMGHHGLVGTSNDALMNLHEALKLEFERVIQQYKGAIAKIDELSLTRNIKDGGPITRSLSQGPAPTFSSHQRLLSLKQEEIQDRLNKNRSLLCALEPCFRTNHSLQILLAILQKRIDYDKETLFQFGQLRKEYVAISTAVSESNGSFSSNPSAARHNNKSTSQLCTPFERDAVVAPVLMRFSHGCAQVLNLLKEIQQETGTEDDDEVVLTAHCITPAQTNTMSASTQGTTADDSALSEGQQQQSSNQSAVANSNLALEPQPSPTCQLENSSHNNGCNGANCIGNRKSTTRTPPTGNGGTTTDDSSDISGYHSDSDGSPISTQSPLANNHNHSHHNHHHHHHHNHHNSNSSQQHSSPSSSSSSSYLVNGSTTATVTNNHCDKLVDRVAILTGRPDGTTLLDGEVTVNCGTRLSVCDGEYPHHQNLHSHQPAGHHHHHPHLHHHHSNQSSHSDSSICRIQVNDKPNQANNNNNNNGDNNDIDNIDDNDGNAAVCLLRCELAQAQARIGQLEASKNALQQKLATQSKRLVALGIGSKFDNLNLDESKQVSGLIRDYEQLYSQVRLDTLDALDQFEELNGLSELKTKLLFSIIVLAYRSTEQTLRDISSSVQSLLRIDNQRQKEQMKQQQQQHSNHHENLTTARQEMENAIGHYLRLTSAYFDTHKNVEEVCTQIWNTLFDYPCLQKCPALVDFVQQCVQLSWSLHVQQSRFSLGIETKMFRDEWHSRAYQSDSFATAIKCYVWPTLFQEGICVYKGIVLT